MLCQRIVSIQFIAYQEPVFGAHQLVPLPRGVFDSLNFTGDFDPLCTYVHTLFREQHIGTATPVCRTKWTSFCEALCHQFTDFLDGWDTQGLMRDPIQGPFENFKSCYKAVLLLANTPENYLTDDKLIDLECPDS